MPEGRSKEAQTPASGLRITKLSRSVYPREGCDSRFCCRRLASLFPWQPGQFSAERRDWRPADVFELQRRGPGLAPPNKLRPNDVKIVALQKQPLFRPNVEPHQVFLEPRKILHAHPRRRVHLAVGQYEASAIRLPKS